MIKPILFLSLISLIFSLHCTTPQKAGWFSFDALSARDHVTQIFQQINSNITTSDSYTTAVNGTNYTISEFYGHTYYNDIFQKDVYIDDNTVNVTGGHISMTFHFNYSYNSTSGSAVGHATADDFWFTKKIQRNNGYITWDPVTINNITMKDNIVISSSEPKLPDTARIAYQNIINNHAQEQNRLRENLFAQINSLYRTKLADSLHNEDLVRINNDNYTYKGITVNYTNAVLDVKLNNVGFKGLQYTFLYEIENYTTECNVLPTAYNTSYGGVQEIYAFGWIKATAKYFADKGLFDVKLDNKWDINMFQFYIGDLGNVIPKAQQYQPDTPITGTCAYRKEEELIVAAQSKNSIRAQIPYTCKLFVNETKLLQTFNFTAVFEEKWSLSGKYIVTNVIYTGVASVTFEEAGDFKVTNTALASQYIKKMLESFEGKPAIGNQFEVVRRNRGGVVIEDKYVIFYDPSE